MDLYNSFKQDVDIELVKLIEENASRDDEIALVIDSTGLTGMDSRDFFKYMKSQYEHVKVYGDVSNVKYINYNSIIVDIGVLFITTLAEPIVVNLISNFIQKKIDSLGTKDIEVRVKIIRKKTQKSSYEEISVSGNTEGVLKILGTISNGKENS